MKRFCCFLLSSSLLIGSMFTSPVYADTVTKDISSAFTPNAPEGVKIVSQLLTQQAPYDVIIQCVDAQGTEKMSNKDRAAASQKELKAFLDANVSSGEIQNIETYYFYNAIHVVVKSRQMLDTLAARVDVKMIKGNEQVIVAKPTKPELVSLVPQDGKMLLSEALKIYQKQME